MDIWLINNDILAARETKSLEISQSWGIWEPGNGGSPPHLVGGFVGGGLCVHPHPPYRKQHFREALVELKESDKLTRVLNGMTTSHLPRKGSTLACCQSEKMGIKL